MISSKICCCLSVHSSFGWGNRKPVIFEFLLSSCLKILYLLFRKLKSLFCRICTHIYSVNIGYLLSSDTTRIHTTTHPILSRLGSLFHPSKVWKKSPSVKEPKTLPLNMCFSSTILSNLSSSITIHYKF